MIYPALYDKTAAPSPDWVRSQYQLLATTFSERNSEYQILRDIFDGQFASVAQAKAKVGTPFQNTTKLIYNIANATVRRYMDSMSAPPRQEGVPEGFELKDIELADKRTKFLEYIYACNDMDVKLLQSAYYQSLMDKSIWHVRPAPHLAHKIRIELGVPDFYYPITRGDDWQHPIAVIYGFRTFKQSDWLKDPMRFNGNKEFDTNIEYWDANWFVRVEPEKVIVINHGLGVIPWVETHNLPIPHRFRGQGDVDQAVGMNEYLNMLMSAMGDMIAYAAAPIAVVRGTKVGGTNLPFEPRAVWELERDAQVGFLQWSGTPPAVEAQILRSIQAIEDLTGVSSPAFGREIPSGVSGNAVRSLMAGFNTRLGTKQQMLGTSLSRLNEIIQLMAEKMFPNEEFRVTGENVIPGKDLGKRRMYVVKPKEFNGWYKNRVVFSPLDPSATYFQETDKFGKGLQSRYTTMKAIGVQNVWDELQRIETEHQEAARRENDMASAKTGNYLHPEIAAQRKQEDDAALENLMKQLTGGNVPGSKPDGAQQRLEMRKKMEAPLKQDPSQTGLVSSPSTGEPPPPPAGPFPAAAVLEKLKAAGNLTGRAAMQGNQIILENASDESTIRQALGTDASLVKFGKLDPDKPLPGDAVLFFNPRKGEKKNPVEIRKIDNGYLSVVILSVEQTNNAYVYVVGVRDEKGEVVPVGKTEPTRSPRPEQGELTRVSVGAISRRADGSSVRWGLGQMRPVKSPSAPAKVDTFKAIERLFEGGHAA